MADRETLMDKAVAFRWEAHYEDGAVFHGVVGTEDEARGEVLNRMAQSRCRVAFVTPLLPSDEVYNVLREALEELREAQGHTLPVGKQFANLARWFRNTGDEALGVAEGEAENLALLMEIARRALAAHPEGPRSLYETRGPAASPEEYREHGVAHPEPTDTPEGEEEPEGGQ